MFTHLNMLGLLNITFRLGKYRQMGFAECYCPGSSDVITPVRQDSASESECWGVFLRACMQSFSVEQVAVVTTLQLLVCKLRCQGVWNLQ